MYSGQALVGLQALPPTKTQAGSIIGGLRPITTATQLHLRFASITAILVCGLNLPSFAIACHQLIRPDIAPFENQNSRKPPVIPINADDNTTASVLGNKGFARASAFPKAGSIMFSYRMGTHRQTEILIERNYIMTNMVTVNVKGGDLQTPVISFIVSFFVVQPLYLFF